MAEELGQVTLQIAVDQAALDAGLAAAKAKVASFAGEVASATTVGQLGTAIGAGVVQSQESFKSLKGQLDQVGAGLPRYTTAAIAAGNASQYVATTSTKVTGALSKVAIEAPKAAAGARESAKGLDQFAASGLTLTGVLQGLLALEVVRQIQAVGQASQRSKIQLEALSSQYGETAKTAESVARIQRVLGISALDARQGYTQLFAALRGTGIGARELEVLFVGLSKAARLSGASTAEAAGALLQLRQGLAAGTLQGDELRSVLEGLPVLTQAIARQLTKVGGGVEVTVGQVKKLGSEGKITSKIVFDAVKELATAQVPALTSAEKLGVAFTNLKEKAAEAFGPAVTDIASKLSGVLTVIADVVERNKARFKDFGAIAIDVAVKLGKIALVFRAIQIAVQAASVAKAAFLALQGPTGWATLLVAAGAGASAFAALEKGGKRAGAAVGKALQKIQQEAEKAKEDFNNVVSEAELKNIVKPDSTLKTISQIEERISTLQGALKGIDPGAPEFNEVSQRIEGLKARLAEVKGSASAISGEWEKTSDQIKEQNLLLREQQQISSAIAGITTKVSTGYGAVSASITEQLRQIQEVRDNISRQNDIERLGRAKDTPENFKAFQDRLIAIDLETAGIRQQTTDLREQAAIANTITGIYQDRNKTLAEQQAAEADINRRLQIRSQLLGAVDAAAGLANAQSELQRFRNDVSRNGALWTLEQEDRLQSAVEAAAARFAAAGADLRRDLTKAAADAAGRLEAASKAFGAAQDAAFDLLTGGAQRQRREAAAGRIEDALRSGLGLDPVKVANALGTRIENGFIRGLDNVDFGRLLSVAGQAERLSEAGNARDQAQIDNTRAINQLREAVVAGTSIVVQVPAGSSVDSNKSVEARYS